MQKKQISSILMLTLLAGMCGLTMLTMPTPVKAAISYNPGTFSCTGATLNGTNGNSAWYWGETNQPVSFSAIFTGGVTGAILNYSWDQVTWIQVVVDPLNIKNIGGGSYSCTEPWTLPTTPAAPANDTGYFNMVATGSGSDSTYDKTIVINIATAENPAPAINMNLTQQPAAKILVTWQQSLIAGKADNAELWQYNIYKQSSGGINTQSQYSSATLAGTVNSTTFQFVDQCHDGETYFYAVAAFDHAGHNSTPSNSYSIIADGTPPSISKFLVNGTDYYYSNITVVTGSALNFQIYIKLPTYGAAASGKFIVSRGTGVNFVQSIFDVHNGLYFNGTTNVYYITLLTTPLNQPAMTLGAWDITLNLTDTAGNVNSTVFPGKIIIIAQPVNPLAWIIPVIIAIAAGSVAVTYVGLKKVKARREEEAVKATPSGRSKMRKGEIYQGASALGRASGDEAEEILAKRKQVGKEPKAPKPEKPSRHAGGRSAGSIPAATSTLNPPSAAPASKTEEFKTIDLQKASAKEIRTMEKSESIDIGKKVDFLSSRLKDQDNLIGMISNLVAMVGEPQKCENCEQPLASDWDQCPWCLVAEQSDELEMALSIAGVGADKKAVCPVCRAPQNPAWSKCPYCATRDV